MWLHLTKGMKTNNEKKIDVFFHANETYDVSLTSANINQIIDDTFTVTKRDKENETKQTFRFQLIPSKHSGHTIYSRGYFDLTKGKE